MRLSSPAPAMGGFDGWPTKPCCPRFGSARPRCATASCRPRTRPAWSTTTSRPTTSSPTTKPAPAAGSARCSSRPPPSTRPGCSPRTRSAATCLESPARTSASARRCAGTARASSSSCSTAGASRSPPRLSAHLCHGGREQIPPPPLPPAIAPSAIPTPRFRAEPRALTQAEIDDLIAGYAASARLCREGGVDGIEVSMAHGYLAAQFFARSTNKRKDAYNGDLDARLRFAREVLAAVRDAAGDGVAVGVRLAADEITPGGLGPEACAEVAAALCAGGGVDFVSAALGHSATYRGSTYIVPPPPEPREAIAGPVAPMRAAIPGVPLIGTTRVADLDAAERLVGSGAVDLVGMTRAMIADPDLLAKAADGRAGEVIPCVGCNQGCIGHYHAGLPIACIVDPRTGRERTLPRPAPV